jgi:hypothetical protein
MLERCRYRCLAPPHRLPVTGAIIEPLRKSDFDFVVSFRALGLHWNLLGKQPGHLLPGGKGLQHV